MKRILLACLTFLSIQIGLNAQCFPDPDISFGTSCSNAPVLCPSGYSITNFCGSTEYNPFGPNINEQPDNFCGTVDNPRWLGFVPATPNLELYIVVENCQGTATGVGMQAMLYEGCGTPGSWVPAADCIFQIYPNSGINYPLYNLTVGQTYYLVLDGWAGDICDFYVEIISGAWAGNGDILDADAGGNVGFNCNSGSVTLNGSNSMIGNNTTYSWYDINDNLIGTGETISVNTAGTYILELTDHSDVCPSRDTVEVFNSGVLQLELGDPIYLDCIITPKVIEGEFVPMDPNYIYQWTTVDGNIVSGANTPNPVVDNAGEYVLTVSDNLNPCSFFDTIKVYGFEDVIEFDSIYYKACNNADTFTLSASTFNVYPSDVIFSWTTSDGIIGGNSNSLNPKISGEGLYNITVTDTVTNCIFVDSVQVIDTLIYNIPQIDFVGDSIFNCNNSAIELTGINSTLFNDVTFRWIKGATNGVVISSDTTATIYQPGFYTLRLRQIGSFCRDDIIIEVFDDFTTPEVVLLDSVIELNCNNNFTETVTPVFQNTANASYQWSGSNNFSSTDSNAIISGDIEGTVELIITDSISRCTTSTTMEVINNGFDIDVIVEDASCDSQDGTAMVTSTLVNSGVEWSNGGQGSTITGLGQDYYSVTVTDTDNNCSKHQNFYIDEDLSCKVVISGYVVNDPNMVCTYDSTMEGIELVMIKLEPLGIYTFTDSTGYYEFVVDDGMYLVQYVENDFVDLQCPVSGHYIVELNTNGTSSDDNHFFIKRKEQDLCITKFTGNAVPGRRQFNCVQICNYGVINESAEVTFVHDPLFSEVMPLPNIIPINSYSFGYTYDEALRTFTWTENLIPGQCKKIMWYMEAPTTAMIGDTVHAEAKVTPIEFDLNPTNNCLSWNAPITAAFDPNDKRNFVGETPWGGSIYEDDETMEYAIRFQNVGTDTAYNVVIRDTLDDVHLDVTSLRGFNSSHDMQVQYEGTNVLIFNFENIMLVDSMTNEEASSGWVTFNINRHPDLPIGTEIKNEAAIYFDYNEPIYTNEIVNIIDAHFLKLEGIILNGESDEVEDVNVMLSYGGTETMITDNTGEFLFEDLTIGEDYNLHFEKDINPLNGVTTFDIVNIHHHILGIELLDSPYKILAADVNNSKTITTLDIIQIRNLILLNTTEFPYSPSWKFVDGDFVFPDPTQPLNANAPESFSFQNLTENRGLNVVGIKMGDVNNTSDPNNLLSIDTRSKEDFLTLSIDNQEVKTGEVIVIGFSTKEFKEMLAYQFTLGFEKSKLEYLGFENGVLPKMDKENLGLRFLEEGQITIAWATSDAENITAEEPLFFLKFKALQNGSLSEMLKINSDKTEALAYDGQGNTFDVKLLFENFEQQHDLQIFPNPVKENIYLNMHLGKTEKVDLEIYNMLGQLEEIVFKNKIQEKGFFHQKISVKEFIPGTYFVKIKIGEKVMMSKIIIL